MPGSAHVGDGQGRIVDRHHAGVHFELFELVEDVLFFVMRSPAGSGSVRSEAAGGDVAAGGGGADVDVGGAVVLEGVADAAVAGAGVQGGGDAGGGADRDVAGLGAEHDRAAYGLGDPDVALAVLISAEPPSRPTSTSPSIAVRRTLAASSILIWRYAPSSYVAEASDAAELRRWRSWPRCGSRRQLDGDLQGSGGAEELVVGGRGRDPRRTPSA